MGVLDNKSVIMAGDSSPSNSPAGSKHHIAFPLHPPQQIRRVAHGVMWKERHNRGMAAPLEKLHTHLNSATGKLCTFSLRQGSPMAHSHIGTIDYNGTQSGLGAFWQFFN